jgi:hypothetical protein
MADPLDDDPQLDEGMPRWVKASAAVVIVLIVAFGVFHAATGGIGNHGT